MNSILRIMRLENSASPEETKAIMAAPPDMLQRTRSPVFRHPVEFRFRLAQVEFNRPILTVGCEDKRAFAPPVPVRISQELDKCLR